MTKNITLILTGLLFWHSAVAGQSPPLPIAGSWQIISYQIVGYPEIPKSRPKIGWDRLLNLFHFELPHYMIIRLVKFARL